MTRRASARLAGAAFLLYIVLGLASMYLFGQATRADGVAARLARMAEHAGEVRLAVVVSMLASFQALVLGVTLYGLTRDEDHELAMLGLAFRVVEGAVGIVALQRSLGLLWLATTSGAGAPDPEIARGLAAYLQGQRWSPTLAAICFAVGSTIFSWLFLRARSIPAPLAWLGVASSALLVVALPLQLGGVLGGGTAANLIWLPMLVFELWLAGWLLARGAPSPCLPRGRSVSSSR